MDNHGLIWITMVSYGYMKTGCRDEIKRRLAMGRAAIKGLD